MSVSVSVCVSVCECVCMCVCFVLCVHSFVSSQRRRRISRRLFTMIVHIQQLRN